MLYERIPFVSEGALYPNKEEFVTLYHLTTKDELLLSAPNNLSDPNCLLNLLKTKISDISFNFGEMLIGDANTLISYLRETAYGIVFDGEISNGEDKEKIEIDLTKLNIEKIRDKSPKIYLPKAKKTCVLRYLTVNDQMVLNQLNALKRPVLTTTLKMRILSVDDNKDKEYISKFVDNMLAYDVNILKGEINKYEFGISQNYPYNGGYILIPINTNLFGLSLDNHQKFTEAVNDEIYVLVKHGRFSYNDIMEMPTYQRKYFIDKLLDEAQKRKKAEESEAQKYKK